MNLGIIGLPQVGKKTIFQLLTGTPAENAPRRDGIAHGIAPVKDPRIDRLSAIFNPRRTRYAEFDLALPPDVQPHASREAEWIDPIRRTDALVHVVRAFDSPTVFHIEGSVDPKRDVNAVETEFLLADLALVETRLERIAKEPGKGGVDAQTRTRETRTLERLRSHLEDERPLRTLDLSDDQAAIVRSLRFLTRKPLVLVFNVGDDMQTAIADLDDVATPFRQRGDTIVFLSAAIEAEIAELDHEERDAFMSELGLREPAAHRLSRAAYQALGLISYFTVGPDEVRAWSVRAGAAAPEAAGRIHSDIERGFIRANTIAYETFVEAGSETNAKQKNLYRLNGKDYIVKDGDIIEFRFNV